MKYRVRFEPVDIEGKSPDEIIEEYQQAKEIIKSSVSVEFYNQIPDIRKIYPVDENGLPVQ